MTGPRIWVVDAFADRPFDGNPAAVVLLDQPASPSWMQSIAAEMNLSETAFLHRADNDEWTLRWYTPTVEVRLCGHATLAAAHVLMSEGLAADRVAFRTRSGQLTARRDGDLIALDMPSRPLLTDAPPDGLAAVFGSTSYRFAGRTGEADPIATDLLVALPDADAVRALRPDLTRLAALPFGGLIVTAQADLPRIDFVSRYFAPRQGIAEDPVTGAAHCVLAPYWSAATGRTAFVAAQLSARSGIVRVVHCGPVTQLSGRAVTVLAGRLTV
ncbi:MAG TPA: PhzF family phenazine biosynthesis protein [Pseudonocardiaceae bacterium]